jgi:hypothetical protein
MSVKIMLMHIATLLVLNQAVAMETRGESPEEDPTIILMKKTWEQRGKITQLRRMGYPLNSSDCTTYQKLEELDRKLDSIARIISEAQYCQYLAQKLTAMGNRNLEEIKKEVAKVEAQRAEIIAQLSEPADTMPIAKL